MNSLGPRPSTHTLGRLIRGRLADHILRANPSAPRFVTKSGTVTDSALDSATRGWTPLPIRQSRTAAWVGSSRSGASQHSTSTSAKRSARSSGACSASNVSGARGSASASSGESCRLGAATAKRPRFRAPGWLRQVPQQGRAGGRARRAGRPSRTARPGTQARLRPPDGAARAPARASRLTCPPPPGPRWQMPRELSSPQPTSRVGVRWPSTKRRATRSCTSRASVCRRSTERARRKRSGSRS
jgi:hypothetical protein